MVERLAVERPTAKRQQPFRLVSRSFAMAAFLAGIAFTTYMLWIGITGQQIPTWFWAIATVL